VGKICNFRLKSPFVSEMLPVRSTVAMELLTGSPRRRIDPCPTIDQLDCGEPLWLVNSRPDRQRDKRWHSSIEL